MGRVKDVWIPRLFIAALLPSVVMLIALVFYPESELARCPLWVKDLTGSDSEEPVLPGQYVIDIQGSLFPINNLNVMPSPVKSGDNLVFLGIVLDVRSGAAFYTGEGGYSALASGVDSTRALLLSSLKPEDMVEDITDQPVEDLRKKLVQWLGFFLNKYRVVGVVIGKYWNIDGSPTPYFLALTELLKDSEQNKDEISKRPVMERCKIDRNEVSCGNNRLVPKIKRSRGRSECVCVDSNTVFAYKTTEFVVVHFQNCTDMEKRCFVGDFEL